MIVKLESGIALNPAHVVSVTRDHYGKFVIVRDVLGDAHEVQVGYRESVYEAEKRVVAILNGPLEVGEKDGQI
nr:hypothetical protein [uncultured Celeribacter sp.]